MDAFKHTPEEVQAAIQQILVRGEQRNGHRPGYNGFVIYLDYPIIVSALPGFSTPSPCSGIALGHKIMNFLKDQDLLIYLIALSVCYAIKREGDHQPLARRIHAQMQSDTAHRPLIRRPLQYVAPTNSGLVCHIVIDDRFWTDEW